jgi:hypothetical protein
MAGAQCCSGACNNGVCGQPCLPDGSMCGADAQCCGGSCDNGVCGGGPQCPSDGSACGDCIAESCCDQFQACLSNPSCLNAVGCFTGCLANGNSFFQCLFQCQVFGNQPALQFIGCTAQSCGNQCT